MATWEKYNRQTEDGTVVEMQAPLIISASRSTDIPAFYADWFFDRLQKDIQHGRIHSMVESTMCHTKIHGLLCFGLKILAHY